LLINLIFDLSDSSL